MNYYYSIVFQSYHRRRLGVSSQRIARVPGLPLA